MNLDEEPIRLAKRSCSGRGGRSGRSGRSGCSAGASAGAALSKLWIC